MKTLNIVVLEDQIEAQRMYKMNILRFASKHDIKIHGNIFSSLGAAKEYIESHFDEIDMIITDRMLEDGISTDQVKEWKDGGKYTIAVTDSGYVEVEEKHAECGNRFYPKADFLLDFQTEFGSIMEEYESLQEQQEIILEVS